MHTPADELVGREITTSRCGTPCSMAGKRTADRRCLTTWISEQGYNSLQRRADRDTDGNLSDLIRRLLRYGMENMPKGWPDSHGRGH